MRSNREEVLAQCLEAIENGMSIEDCLEQYPQQREELLEMLDMVQVIRNEAEQVALRAQFRRSANSRLMSRLPERRVTFWSQLLYKIQGAPFFSMRSFSFAWTFVAVFAIVFFAGSGVVYASGSALPGDSLYGVKGMVEKTLLFISNDQGDLHLHYTFAERRLKEMESLAAADRVNDMEEAVNGYISELVAISLMVEENTGEETKIASEELSGISEGQNQRLESLMEKVPDQVKQHLLVAIEANAMVAPGKSGIVVRELQGTGKPQNTTGSKTTRRSRNTDMPADAAGIRDTATLEDTATQVDTAMPVITATQDSTATVQKPPTKTKTATPVITNPPQATQTPEVTQTPEPTDPPSIPTEVENENDKEDKDKDKDQD